jgi:predicted DNA-binding transcriptional regulator YafY
MRADRLLAEVLILQRRGTVTAAELAAELEVSERTIHRDTYALRVAGVPIVTERGVGGGIAILGRWRTDLTGLKGRELAALSLMAAVDPVSRIDDSARTALAKLGSLLPDHLRPDDAHLLLDVDADPAEAGEVQLVGVLDAAIRSRRSVRLTLLRTFDTIVSRDAHPLGLVFSARSWHLVWTAGDDRIRVDRLAAVRSVEEGTGESVIPKGFELHSFWESHRATMQHLAGGYTAVAVVDDGAIAELLGHLTGKRRGGDGRTEVELRFDSFRQARATVLSLGGAIEVLEPEALRRSVADFAEQTRARYR